MQKALIFKEFSEEKSLEWFSYTRDKFISHVDTLYYTVKARGDWSMSLGARSLVGALKAAREEADKLRDSVPFMRDSAFTDMIVKPFFGFHMYRYGVSKPDCFDIFVAENVPNLSTSEIVVQLRSEYLWLSGTKRAYYESLDYLYAIVNRFGVEIGDIKENRIDFAYHTNYIQDMLSFFADKNLREMQVSSFGRWGKEGCFTADEIHTDYISLGRRKSNSVFIRIYNKSKEVIEMGYKQFFVLLWRQRGLISEFDKYIFEKVFEEGGQSWNYKETARCLFYIEHGRDVYLKEQMWALTQKVDASAGDFKKLADMAVPDLTNVVNLEIQAKSKFTRDLVFPNIEYPEGLPLYEKRMHKILGMLQSIRDYLTTDTIRFVRYKGEFAKVRRDLRPVAGWWKRLASCGELDSTGFPLCRDYQRKYDVLRAKRRSLSGMASFATLLERWDRRCGGGYSLEEDFADMLCALNDNDFARYAGFRDKKRRELGVPVADAPEPDDRAAAGQRGDEETQTVFTDFWEGLNEEIERCARV